MRSKVRARSSCTSISPARTGRPCRAYTAADVGNTVSAGSSAMFRASRCDTGKPLAARSIAGASTSDSGSVPYRPCAAVHPRSSDGTEAESTPFIGMPVAW